MRKLFLLLLLASTGVPVWLAAQASPPVVEAHWVLPTDAVHAGSTTRVAVVATIASGYHINDHKPTLDYLIPTELKVDPGKEIRFTDVAYPKGTSVKFEFSDQPLSVYQGRLVVEATLKVAAGVAPGTYRMQGKLAYQACNDHACLAPTSVPLTLAVKVVAAGVPVRRVNSDVFSRAKSARAAGAN
ncbi:MAG TPA: protein-disulfide reductase DsbD domain-containing protein [Terriglobia bacterium]|nr:protein-disulfide reductase DsbD domain-containing protein [Terriglobia bacterium]